MMRAVADQGVNTPGFSAAVVGNKCVAYIGFDQKQDADRAASALKRLDAGRAAGGARKAAPRAKPRGAPKANARARR